MRLLPFAPLRASSARILVRLSAYAAVNIH